MEIHYIVLLDFDFALRVFILLNKGLGINHIAVVVYGQSWLTMLLCPTFRIGFEVLTSGLNSKYSGYFLMLQGC